MKNIYITISLFFLGMFMTTAQFTLATHSGDPITDGSIFTFSQLGEYSKLSFDITNTGSETIDMRLEYVSMTNGDGTGTWLCVFGSCLEPGGINVGDIFPYTLPNSHTIIEPGVTTDYGDYFYNTYGDGTNFPLDYVFRFFQVDATGDEIGDSITFTYRYDGTASLEDKMELTHSLYPTISSDFVNLLVKENVTGQLFNTQGQILKEYNFEKGVNKIDVSLFSKQLYYLVLINENSQRGVSKIIVK